MAGNFLDDETVVQTHTHIFVLISSARDSSIGYPTHGKILSLNDLVSYWLYLFWRPVPETRESRAMASRAYTYFLNTFDTAIFSRVLLESK